MPLTPAEKYLRLKEKLKNSPSFYKEFQKKHLERQRKYAEDPEYCKKRSISTADWKARKANGLPTRHRGILKPAILLGLPAPTSSPKGTPFPFVFSVSFD